MSGLLMGQVFYLDPAGFNSTRKLVLLAFVDHADNNGARIYPSVALLCHKTSLSERAVRGATSWLRSQGILKVVRQATPRRPYEYRLDTRKLLENHKPFPPTSPAIVDGPAPGDDGEQAEDLGGAPDAALGFTSRISGVQDVHVGGASHAPKSSYNHHTNRQGTSIATAVAGDGFPLAIANDGPAEECDEKTLREEGDDLVDKNKKSPSRQIPAWNDELFKRAITACNSHQDSLNREKSKWQDVGRGVLAGKISMDWVIHCIDYTANGHPIPVMNLMKWILNEGKRQIWMSKQRGKQQQGKESGRLITDAAEFTRRYEEDLRRSLDHLEASNG